jgi:hypothetical protein
MQDFLEGYEKNNGGTPIDVKKKRSSRTTPRRSLSSDNTNGNMGNEKPRRRSSNAEELQAFLNETQMQVPRRTSSGKLRRPSSNISSDTPKKNHSRASSQDYCRESLNEMDPQAIIRILETFASADDQRADEYLRYMKTDPKNACDGKNRSTPRRTTSMKKKKDTPSAPIPAA